MSEREFETYLSLLCRLLRLDAEQREAISRELRDHLEERLEELKSLGVCRDEAVRLALEEFGDAAGLAAEFSSIARNVKRRWLMRMTLGSTIAAAAAAMLAMAFWPDSRQPGPAPLTAIAQETPGPATPKATQGQAPAALAGDDTAPPLARRINAEFVAAPLTDVLDFLSDAVGGQFYISEKRLAAEGIPLDSAITLHLKDARADMLLELALDQASDQLAYAVRDGVVIISTLEDLEGAAEVRVYNVRDLLKLPPAGGAMGIGADAAMAGGPYAAGAAGYGAEGMSMSAYAPSFEDRATLLTQVIMAAVGQQHWEQGHDYGTMASYDGLLVVNHNARIHQQVERLLEMLRSAAAQEKAAPEARPAAPGADVERNDNATREKFAKRIAAEFVETPLADVLEHLSDRLDVQIYANWKQIEAAEASQDTPVSLNLSRIRGAMALELSLAQAGEQLAYVIRDGVVIVSTVEDLDGAAMLRVYNCRDLLAQSASSNMYGAGMMPGSGGAGYGGSPYGAMAGMGMGGGMAMGGMGMGPAGMPGGTGEAATPPSSSAAEPLVNILTTSIAPSSWQSAGGTGTLAEYNGLIVVNHNARVHAQVEQVLKMVREAAKGDKTTVTE